ncbi:hypothetical protein PIB30_075399 [Stylosanthes scabra]|uniref:RNase H type-1 domain-containing protein n=1 Tax=Stylosanthes scabra TaxID=79078 RepID=A0ABU6YNW9_9FABA|nr:hypothetical protein [Stylosanthes scabra]
MASTLVTLAEAHLRNIIEPEIIVKRRRLTKNVVVLDPKYHYNLRSHHLVAAHTQRRTAPMATPIYSNSNCKRTLMCNPIVSGNAYRTQSEAVHSAACNQNLEAICKSGIEILGAQRIEVEADSSCFTNA